MVMTLINFLQCSCQPNVSILTANVTLLTFQTRSCTAMQDSHSVTLLIKRFPSTEQPSYQSNSSKRKRQTKTGTVIHTILYAAKLSFLV